jgi:Gpi18-like mannosyltransferase
MLKSFKWRLPEAWRWAILVWLIARLALTLISVLLTGLHAVPANSPYGNLYFEITPLRDGWPGALLGVWQRWDAIHYLRIARFGYGGNGLLAFFPLYPVLARLLSTVLGGNILLSMLVISNVATIVAFATLYHLTQDFFSTALARLAVIALAVYPAAIYLYAPYAEPLAICLVLVAYQAARQMRWKTALLAGVAAGLSQPIAVPAIVLLGWEVWQKRQLRLMPLAAALGPTLGVGAYFLWSAQSVGRSYLSVQNSWGRNFQWPWQNALDIVQMFRSGAVFIGG